jgi:hypothetical protein
MRNAGLWLVVSLVGVLGCGRVADGGEKQAPEKVTPEKQEPSPPGPHPIKTRPAPAKAKDRAFTFLSLPEGTAGVTGRIVVDGKPVTSYALALGRNPQLGVMDDTLLVTDVDGRFRVPDVAAGNYHLFVGAHGFMRTTTEVSLSDDHVTDLGDVPLVRGVRVTGRVVDGDGQPLASADVRVAGGPMAGSVLSGRHFDALHDPTADSEALHGRQRVTTQPDGRYELYSPVPAIDGAPLYLTAGTAGDDSPRTTIPSRDATLDLAVGAYGDLEGELADADDMTWVRYRRVEGGDPGEVHARGPHFVIPHLPAGTYEVWLFSLGSSSPRQPASVAVASHGTAGVRFAPVAAAVELTVRCDHHVTIAPAGTTTPDRMELVIAQGLCMGGELVFSAAEPGNYAVCGKRCIPMTVAPAPIRQTFDATAALTSI